MCSIIFFFSSRRRHTRCSRDWSSDVCSSDLEVGTASFAQAIADELRRRPWGPVVRIEVERTMPPLLRELLQRELRFEESALQSALGPSDVYEADGPLDLGGLGELAAGAARPDLDYLPFTPRDPFAGDCGVFEALDRGDVLVHHPYDSFGASVERFIAEAADDPDVAAIKLTLYRPGGPSRIAEALRRAAAHGKDVSVYVELKARFDEELNIGWAQSLEAAGIHVITGLAALKIHAKVALVVRRTAGRTRRYARSEEHTSELQSRLHLVCRLLLEKKKKQLHCS